MLVGLYQDLVSREDKSGTVRGQFGHLGLICRDQFRVGCDLLFQSCYGCLVVGFQGFLFGILLDLTLFLFIGAGPSGLSVLHVFKNDAVDITVFEKQSLLGGQWNLDNSTGVDDYGEVVHGAVVKN